jgi:hypothetical protein
VKLGQRRSDASEMAFIEWVDMPASAIPEPKDTKAKAAEAKGGDAKPKRTKKKVAEPAEAEAKS